LRQFLGVPLDLGTPDHSTLTNTRKRLPAEVFQFVLAIAVEKRLVEGETVGVDSTTLEANAAMKSIVRRDTGEVWKGYVTRLMREEGVIGPGQEPTAEEVRRFDQKRKGKTVSNADWVSGTDADARIATMKDGRTHLAYKAEHVVDLKSDLVLAAVVRPADHADTATLMDSVMVALVNIQAAGSQAEIDEVAADKGYHAAETLELCAALGLRTYVPERRSRHRSRWVGKPAAFQRAVSWN
jgi:transposase